MARRRSRPRKSASIPWDYLLFAGAGAALAYRAGTFPLLALGFLAALPVGFLFAWKLTRNQSRQPARTQHAPRRQPELHTTRRARSNGWLEPKAPALTSLHVSRECAGDRHALCPGENSGCQCVCRHNSRIIVALNQAKATVPPDDEIPPF